MNMVGENKIQEDLTEIKVDITGIKSDVCYLKKRIDDYILKQEAICQLKHIPIDEHVKDGPKFRDKVVTLETWQRVMWIVLSLMLTGVVSGFFMVIRQ